MLSIIVQHFKLPNRKVLLEGDYESRYRSIGTGLIDVTEQEIERPVKKQIPKHRDYYFGKKNIPYRCFGIRMVDMGYIGICKIHKNLIHPIKSSKKKLDESR